MSYFFPGHEGWANTAFGDTRELAAKVTRLTFGDDVWIRGQTLPFYPDLEFLVCRDPSWAPSNLYIYLLRHGSELYWLNGTSPPIHELNASGHLKLSDGTALDYLKFFTFFVRGEEGPFYVVDSLYAPYLPHLLRASSDGGSNPSVSARLGERYQSPREFGKSEDGKWRFSATVCYSNAIFVADFLVQPGGMIEMADDWPVLTDLTIKISAPITPDPVST